MTPIPPKVKKEILADPSYKTCMKYGQFGHECSGRITWEHVLTFAGRQVQKKWAIISLCEFGHSVGLYQDGGDLEKEINLWIALNRATNAEMLEISKAIPYTREKVRLNNEYGSYTQKYPIPAPLKTNQLA